MNYSNNFLGRWLNEDLSEKELEQFKQSEDYTTYESLFDGLSKLKIKEYPSDDAYTDFKNKLEQRHKSNEISNENNFLGRWLEDSLSDDELKNFEQTNEFIEYKSIVDGIDKLKIEDYSTETAYSDLKNKIKQRTPQKKKTTVFYLKRNIAIAAGFLILLGLGYFSTNKTIETQVASQQNIILPDKSRVSLNSKSKLSYNTILFNLNRTLKLEGEAFFEVEKGSKFTVKTNNGSVNVLGTKFNVVSRDDYFETSCFEGKVGVKTLNNESILTKGKQVRYINNIKENHLLSNKNPEWRNGISKFKSTPLKYVIENIEIHYKIIFDTSNIKDTSMLFSGSFFHNSLDQALENVFLPMGIEYSINKESKTVVLKNK